MAAELTRRSEKGPNNESWFVYFGDVRVGHIGLRAGVPGWTCGFYPGCDPEQQTHGTGQTFQEAEAGFEEAWNRLRSTRTEAPGTRLHRMEIPDAGERPEGADRDEERPASPSADPSLH